MSCTGRHIQLLSTLNHVPGISACGTCKSGAFFITRDGWYSESGLSTRQAVGVTPDEHHQLCEWLNNAGTRCLMNAVSSANGRTMQVRGTRYALPGMRYPELVGDSQHRPAAFSNTSVVTNSTAAQFSATNLHASPHS